MSDDPVITRFSAMPDYGRGFAFSWEVRPDFEEPGPWEFLVQAAQSPSGEWRDVSPVIGNAFAWRSDAPVRLGKGYVLYFRLLMRSPSGIHESHPCTPYGDLSRREYLMGRDVMRIAVLQSRTLAGVEVDLWSSSTWGPRCDCRDPVTGRVRDTHCRKCLGTGYSPGYHGPFRVWADFSPNVSHSVEAGQDGSGVVSLKQFEVRMVASVPMKKGDAIRDVRSGKVYYVDKAVYDTEIRRVPLLQVCTVMEAPMTDAVYALTSEPVGMA